MTTTTRIPIKYSKAWSWLLTGLLLLPRWSYLEISGDVVKIRLGWAFRAKVRRGDISTVEPFRPVVSIGAHGWRGRWLVNGANRPIARVTLALPGRAFVMGVPVSLRELLVSVDDVAELRGVLLT